MALPFCILRVCKNPLPSTLPISPSFFNPQPSSPQPFQTLKPSTPPLTKLHPGSLRGLGLGPLRPRFLVLGSGAASALLYKNRIGTGSPAWRRNRRRRVWIGAVGCLESGGQGTPRMAPWLFGLSVPFPSPAGGCSDRGLSARSGAGFRAASARVFGPLGGRLPSLDNIRDIFR